VYLHTTFNEGAAGSALNGTHPATDTTGNAWVDTAGDWTYQTGGGVKSSVQDEDTPATIDVGHSDYVVTLGYPDNNNASYLELRHQDNLNFIRVGIGNFDVNIATMIAGAFAKPLEFFRDTSGGSVVITLSGNTVTVTAGGQTQSATLPTGQRVTNTIGLLPHTVGLRSPRSTYRRLPHPPASLSPMSRSPDRTA
jgi:hypothetical protein